MSRLRFAALAAGLAMCCGCASNNPDQAKAKDSDLICTRETPIGTNLSVTRCRTQAQLDRERAAAREMADDMMRQQESRPSPTQ